MGIKIVSKYELKKMSDKEGLVIQGCGGELQDWIDGINEILTQNDILKNGTKFENVYVFQNENCTNILFPFDDKLEMNIGRLAMWRLQTHCNFGGTWLSDYVPNYLGGFVCDENEYGNLENDFEQSL